MGQAVRCKTLLGLRQQLWAGLLQIILAARRRSRSLMWSPALRFCVALAAFLVAAPNHIFPVTGQGFLCSGEGCCGFVRTRGRHMLFFNDHAPQTRVINCIFLTSLTIIHSSRAEINQATCWVQALFLWSVSIGR